MPVVARRDLTGGGVIVGSLAATLSQQIVMTVRRVSCQRECVFAGLREKMDEVQDVRGFFVHCGFRTPAQLL
jgi:hypothetical protein